MIGALLSNVPGGPIDEKWTQHKFDMKLVAPNNRRKFDVIIIGSGLAGASAAATLGEQGYNVKVFTYHDSPRRAHSIAAQGGINAAKNYKGDGDSVQRLFYDTVKGGDFRSREANVYRLAEVSVDIIDQMRGPGRALRPRVRRPARQPLLRRRPGQSRTFYARGQTGQQLLLGAYQQMMHQVHLGTVELHTRTEMLDLVVKDGRACGIVVRDLVTGEVSRHSAHAVLLCTGGYGNVFYLSTNAMDCNVTATWRAHRRGALFANPCYTQIHPTCIPAVGRVPVEAHADVGVAPQRRPHLGAEEPRRDPLPRPDPRGRARLLPRAEVPELRQPRAARRRHPQRQDDGRRGQGRRPAEERRLPRLRRRHQPARRRHVIRERYGNLFDMYERITDENPYKVPMRIYPAVHYTMGGLWVDYNLMTNVPGLFVLGEANFSDHGANRLGASALMQGLADGYFVIRYTIANYLAGLLGTKPVPVDDPAFAEAQQSVDDRVKRFLSIGGTKSVDHYHRELGKIMWDYCGMARNKTGLEKALAEIPALREEFWKDVRVLGDGPMNQSPREGRPGRRLLRARRAHGARRPQPRGVLRRPLPRGAPDRGGRGPARRRPLRLRRRVGVGRRGRHAHPPQGAPHLRVRPPDPALLQVEARRRCT